VNAPTTAPSLHGPIATADALQTLKPCPRLIRRILDNVELGPRVCQHITEVTR
jgi:hypothetical protein